MAWHAPQGAWRGQAPPPAAAYTQPNSAGQQLGPAQLLVLVPAGAPHPQQHAPMLLRLPAAPLQQLPPPGGAYGVAPPGGYMAPAPQQGQVHGDYPAQAPGRWQQQAPQPQQQYQRQHAQQPQYQHQQQQHHQQQPQHQPQPLPQLRSQHWQAAGGQQAPSRAPLRPAAAAGPSQWPAAYTPPLQQPQAGSQPLPSIQAAAQPHAVQQQHQQHRRQPEGLVPWQQLGVPPAEAAWLEALGAKVSEYAAAAAPTPREQQMRDDVFALLAAAIPRELRLPRARVLLFGSGASGLALHCSDIDIVVAGVVQPDPVQGLHPRDKAFVVECLRALHAWAASPRCPLAFDSMRLVPWARVPLLKLKLAGGPEVDVSFGDEGGCAAAQFAASMGRSWPVLRPLVLVLKGMLRDINLHEVYLGGLGSWSLINMVLAHLAEEARGLPPGAPLPPAASHPGAALLAFLRRFSGRGVYDYGRHAVALRRGGVVDQGELGPGFAKHTAFLVLEDPLTGREVAGGSHRMPDVAAALGRAAARLDADCDRALAATAGGAPRRSLVVPEEQEGGGARRSFKRMATGDGTAAAAARAGARDTAEDAAAQRVSLISPDEAAAGGNGAQRPVRSIPSAGSEPAADSPAAPLSEPRPQRAQGGADAPARQRRASAPEATQADAGSGAQRPLSLAEALAAGPGNGSKRRRGSSSSDGDGSGSSSDSEAAADGDKGCVHRESGSHRSVSSDEQAAADPWAPLSCVLNVPAALARAGAAPRWMHQTPL